MLTIVNPSKRRHILDPFEVIEAAEAGLVAKEMEVWKEYDFYGTA
jgi:hypothetical protein